MSAMVAAELQSGVIYGDAQLEEYVYMPAGEIGMKEPLCVYEFDGKRDDVSLREAIALVRKRSLKPARHPKLGTLSC